MTDDKQMTVIKQMNLDEIRTLGDIFVKSGFFTDARDASQAIVKIIAGRELGFPPLASMMGVYIVNGKPALSANLMATRVKASGKYDYRVLKNDNTICEIEYFQFNANGRESLGVSTFTLEDARKAGTKNLDRFARNMLFARCMSNGVKWFCPDATNGVVVYTPEELGAETDEDGNPIRDITPHGVERAVNKETGEVTETDPFPPDFGDRPVVTAAKERIANDLVESERKHESKPLMRTAPMSSNQHNKLIELYIERFGGTETEADQGLDAVFESAFKHPMSDASLAEASKIISQMIAQKTGTSKGMPKKQEPKTDRPFDPQQLRAWMQQKYEEYLTKPVPSSETLEKMRGLATGTLAQWYDDEKRHWVLDALWGIQSSKDMNYMHIASLLALLAVKKGEDGKYHETEDSGTAHAEINLLLEVYQMEKGQDKLF